MFPEQAIFYYFMISYKGDGIVANILANFQLLIAQYLLLLGYVLAMTWQIYTSFVVA